MTKFEHADILDLLGGDIDDNAVMRLVFECLISGIDDDRVVSLMNLIGWRGSFSCFALGGTPADSMGATFTQISSAVRDFGGSHAIFGMYGRFVIACIELEAAVSPEIVCTAALPAFAQSEAVYLSPVREGVPGASHAVRETLFSLQAAPSLSTQSRPLRADELLPERALLGDEVAREELYRNVYLVLHGDNEDDPSYITVSTFLRHGGSLEATAKELNVHPNTVRYRLKKAAETTGCVATNPRDAFVLNTAIALGRMREAGVR